MQLYFKTDLGQPLGHTLTAARYMKFWDEHQQSIMVAFARHTGLQFQQRKITVRMVDGPTSRAGNAHRPMELSTTSKDPIEIGTHLLHELAHRLVIGNGIEPSDANAAARSRASYHLHRHIYLFLYDVVKDVMGSEAAAREIAGYSPRTDSAYAAAWKWAMAMDYAGRQAAFKRLKQRYGAQ